MADVTEPAGASASHRLFAGLAHHRRSPGSAAPGCLVHALASQAPASGRGRCHGMLNNCTVPDFDGVKEWHAWG